MKKLLVLAALATVICFSSDLRAQVPQLINYQGRVAVTGTNFNSPPNGQFKFALVSGTSGATTFWSNDGTSTAGSQPTNAILLTVTNGLYSVLLGDTALTNMTAVPANVFGNSDVRLRVWFNDGTHGSQLLSPDQRIAAVGYAMMSANVSDGAITTAKIASGAVGSAQLAANAVQSANLAAGSVGATQIASGAVGTTQIAAGAVGATQIASGAVGFSDLAKPPQSGTVDGAGLSFEFGQSSFSVTFPQAFAAAPVVALSLAPSSSTFPLNATTQVKSSGTTQFAGRIAVFTYPPETVDSSTRDVGEYTSLAVVNGNPAISYNEATTGELKYVIANDTGGTSWGTPVTVSSDNGEYTSLAVVNGKPAISYYDQSTGRCEYVRATDTFGTAWGTPVIVDFAGGPAGQYTSLAVVNGNPAISYYDQTNGNLKYVRATETSGTAAWGTPLTLDSTGVVGLDTSLAVVNGNPAISYYDSTNGNLKYVRATETSGTAAWGTPLTLDSTGVVGLDTSLAVVNGNPAISYFDGTNGHLKYIRATETSGTAAWGTPLTLDSTSDVGDFTSLAVVNGNPAISYYDATNGYLKYMHAADASGIVWGTPLIIDSTGVVGEYTSLAVVNGNPAISYFDQTNGHLKYISGTPPSTAFKINWIALPP